MAASTGSNGTAGRSAASATPARILCLGNELISDDGVGIAAARELSRRFATAGTPVEPTEASADPAVTTQAYDVPGMGRVELVETALTGMYLLETVVGASRLIVIDSVVTGASDPGTVLVLAERDLDGPRGVSPHYIGILETLDLARGLELAVPAEVVIVAIEAGDYWTVGGGMTDLVEAAVPVVVDRTMALLSNEAALTA